MAHKEAEMVRWHLSFKERDHVLPDGTRRGRNGEVALVVQRDITYILMAHEEAEMVRWHLSFKERDHVLPDGT
jgi:hypothetical protein